MRQGISLILSQSFDQVWTFSLSSLHIYLRIIMFICALHPSHQMHKVHWIPNVKSLRIPKIFAFLRIIQSLAYYCIQVSRFPHISQRFWFPADCPISCIFTVYKYQKLIQCTLSLCIAYIPKILFSCGLTNQGSRIYPKNFGFLRIIQSLAYYCIQVSRFPHICLHCAIMFTVYKYQEL